MLLVSGYSIHAHVLNTANFITRTVFDTWISPVLMLKLLGCVIYAFDVMNNHSLCMCMYDRCWLIGVSHSNPLWFVSTPRALPLVLPTNQMGFASSRDQDACTVPQLKVYLQLRYFQLRHGTDAAIGSGLQCMTSNKVKIPFKAFFCSSAYFIIHSIERVTM
jgi:hypothetical protein